MRVLISGATGLLGNAVREAFLAAGDEVTALSRKPSDTMPTIVWNVAEGKLDTERLESFDVVIHLAGESVAKRWTRKRKARILSSRRDGTRLLARSLALTENKPRVLISASGAGIYGCRGDELLTEASEPANGFLTDVAREWESGCEPARDAGIRVVNIRIGMVLSRDGGALSEMLTPFRFCVGGRLGNGRQWWSWIAINDLVAAIRFLIARPEIAGPVNLVSPQPVTNREFTKTLGKVLKRPTILPMPGFLLKLLFGQMAKELLLCSAKIEPRTLLDAGFEFSYPELEPALRHVLGR